jgi:hypothetical protein
VLFGRRGEDRDLAAPGEDKPLHDDLRSGGRAQEPHLRRIGAGPQHELRGAIFRDTSRAELGDGGLKRLLNGAAEPDGEIERRRKFGGRLAPYRAPHADRAVDVLGDGLHLRPGMTRVQDDDPNLVLVNPEQIRQHSLPQGLGAALVILEHDLFVGGAVAAEVDDVRPHLKERLLQIAGTDGEPLDELDRIAMRRLAERLANLARLSARVHLAH